MSRSPRRAGGDAPAPPPMGECLRSPPGGRRDRLHAGGADANALSLLFSVFLLLAALVATLAAKTPVQALAETAAMASLADRFAPAGDAAGRAEGELLSALERLRPRLERAAGARETDPTTLEGDWSVTVPAERLFADGPGRPLLPERRILLYRLAQALSALAREGAALEVAAGPGPLDTDAPARLAEICRRLVELGAPATALRLRLASDGPDAVTLTMTGARRDA